MINFNLNAIFNDGLVFSQHVRSIKFN